MFLVKFYAAVAEKESVLPHHAESRRIDLSEGGALRWPPSAGFLPLNDASYAGSGTQLPESSGKPKHSLQSLHRNCIHYRPCGNLLTS